MPTVETAINRPGLSILHVLGSLNRGGIETWLANAAKYRNAQQFHWSFCTYRYANGSYTSELQRLGIPSKHIQLENTVLGLLVFACRFFLHLRRHRFDIVHGHGENFVGVLMFLAWLAGVPVRIAHTHSSTVHAIWDHFPGRFSNRLGPLLARTFCSRGIACSEVAAEGMFGPCWKKNRNVQIIHCGIDLSRFAVCKRDKTERLRLGILPNAKVLGCVANFTPPKNHQFLIGIFEETSRRLPDAILCLVGSGPLRTSVESCVLAANLQDRVVFAGVSDDIPQKLMTVFDAFAMPSLYEGLPVALLEAQAAGLRCVISDRISKQAVVRSDTVTSVSLQDRAKWVESLVEALTLPRPLAGFNEMAGSTFDIRTSVATLEAFYLDAAR